MRITLMHNPGAGRGEHEADDLMALLAEAGHDATYQSTNEKGYTKALTQPTDLVIAAGGDGTVEKIARCLMGGGVPLSVLPLGTANNLARTLGEAEFLSFFATRESNRVASPRPRLRPDLQTRERNPSGPDRAFHTWLHRIGARPAGQHGGTCR